MEGQVGVVVAWIDDPVSSLLQIVLPDQPQAIGFYHGTRVQLYHTYDSSPLDWMRLGLNLDQLQSCSFCRRLLFYPLLSEQSKFLTGMMKLIRENGSLPHQKLAVFASLLRDGRGDSVTGYSLVNRALLDLDGLELTAPSDRLVLSPHLGQPTSWSQEAKTEWSPELLPDLVHLTAVFTFLFLKEEQFRARVTALSQWRQMADLDHDTISQISQAGWERDKVNQLITQSNQLRSALGLSLLPLVTVPLEPALSLGIYLDNCQVNQEPIQEAELLRHYNSLAKQWQLPLVNGETGPGPMLGQLGALSRSQLEELLVYLDVCANVNPLLQNKILVELRQRQEEQE